MYGANSTKYDLYLRMNRSMLYSSIQWGYQLTKKVQNGGVQAISEILHIENQIFLYCDISHTDLKYEQV